MKSSLTILCISLTAKRAIDGGIRGGNSSRGCQHMHSGDMHSAEHGKYRDAVFDLDGVIVDTAKYHYLAWKR